MIGAYPERKCYESARLIHAASSLLMRKTVPTPVFRSRAIRCTPRLAAKALLIAIRRPGLQRYHRHLGELLRLNSEPRIKRPRESRFLPELLARHCTEAGLIERAAPMWVRAGS